MKPTDIDRIVTLGAPALSPDGATAVVAATRIDLADNDYRSTLWLVATDGSTPPRQLTRGEHDGAPRYSPDGRWIAFLRTPAAGTAAEGRAQLHLLPTGGGDARAVTDLPLGAGEPHWSPDGRRLAFVARVPEPGRYGQDDKIPAGKEAPRRITGLTYRRDGVGFLIDRRSHVFVLDVDENVGASVEDAAVRQLTDGDWDDTAVAWSPDSTQLVFVSARHEQREHDRRADAFVLGADGSGLRQVTRTELGIEGVRFTADGAGLLLVGADLRLGDGDSWLARNEGLWHVRLDGAPAAARRLTDEQTVHVAAGWIELDGERALVAVENRGAIDLLATPLQGTQPVTLHDGLVSSGRRQLVALDRAGDVAVVTYTDAGTSGELGRLESDGTVVPLTDFAAPLREVLVPIGEVEATAPDGYPVHGFLTVPAGNGPHPVLLMIHGGPFAQYGWTMLDEAQVYAAAGYAVVYGNPRGSSGYGQAHGRYIIGDVGDRQTPDLLALLDSVLTRDDLDATRVGVLGGSHGGYMTTWLVGHTDRFGAAVSERAVNAIDSFEGSSDIGWDFADHLYGTDPHRRRHESPLTYADAISTPLLIVHSEQDWRCPIEQAQRLYVAIRKRSTDVEMLLFPGEGHELSRSGVPGHRVARFEAILDWFGRYLQARG